MSFIADLLQLLGFAKTATAAALPPRLPVAWVGIDRSSMKRVAGAASDPSWYGLLLDNSNLRFVGAYLEGITFPPGATADQFTASTKDVARDWIPHVAALRTEGWGVAFWYVGYSIGGGEPLPPLSQLAAADYAARGRLHAQHAKTIISGISPAMDGAVVYFDNEDPSSTTVSSLIPYYDAFFDELQSPGPGTLPALRPGLYAHAAVGAKFLNTYPYVFLWEVTYDTATTTTPAAPFDRTANPLIVDATRSLGPVILTNGAQQNIGWSVGRQFRSYTGSMPVAGSAITTTVAGLNPYGGWDYDSSVVRDPAYPSADPRVAAGVAPGSSPGTSDPVVIEGKFTARTSTDPPQMTVDMIGPAGHANIPLLPSTYVEPDAPLARVTFPGAQQTSFATVLTTGDIAACDSAGRTWLNTGSAATIQLRRLRALAFAAFTGTDLQIFLVGQDRALWALRNAGGAWGTPAQMGGALRLHPSALLAATSRATASVDVFTFNDAGLLTTSWWSTTSASWPDSNSQVLDAAPGLLLPTSALAAVSAAANKLHVFAIGKDQRLRYIEFTNTNWGALQTLGSPTQFVFPHSGLAALVISATRVQVAVIADNGNLRVHTLDGSSGAWAEVSPAQEFSPPLAAAPAGYTPPAPGVSVETAYGWRINPYSDLSMSMVNGSPMIFAAGLQPGQTAALRRSTAPGSEWERYR